MGAHAALYGDPRFLLASWPARAVYQQLLDGRDAIGDWLAPAGDDLVAALAATVRCDRADAAAILAEMERRGLVAVGPGRVHLLVAVGRGVRTIGTGHVYFVRDDAAGAVKIGWTRQLASRLAALQTASANRLVLLGRIPGSLADEAALHQRFAGHRVRGEWFRADPELLAAVAELTEAR
jgi:hypothetical protein